MPSIPGKKSIIFGCRIDCLDVFNVKGISHLETLLQTALTSNNMFSIQNTDAYNLYKIQLLSVCVNNLLKSVNLYIIVIITVYRGPERIAL